MALTDSVDLDISAALAQLARLEGQLNELRTGVTIPVNVTEDQTLDQLRRDIAQIDAENVTVDVTATGVTEAGTQFDRLNRELDQTETELRQVSTIADRTGDQLADTGRRGTAAFDGLRSSFGGFVGAIAAAQGIRVLSRFLGEAVLAASELEQAVGGVESVFGEASEAVTDFAPRAAQAVGLTNQAFLQLSAILGGQLQAFGFGMAEAADEAIRLVEVGADLAATYGGPVQDAVAAISSLLRGETNPIERYAIAINQAAINAEALRLGLVETTSEIGLQEKATAALSLLQQQSANAQGQFAREADTTAGRLERIRAEAGNAAAALGESLIPAFEGLLTLANPVIDLVGTFAIAIGELTGTIDTADAAVSRFELSANVAIDALDTEANRLAAFLTVLQEENIGGLSDTARDLAQAFRLTGESLILLRDQGNRDFLADMGFDAEFIDNVLIPLLEVELPKAARIAADAARHAAAGAGAGRTSFAEFSPEVVRFANSLAEADRVVRTEADSLDILGFHADQAGVSIGELLQDVDSLPPSLQALAGNLSQSTLEFLAQVDAINEAQLALEDLPSSLDIVAETFRDKEGEILTSVDQFIQNLTDQAENTREFEINLARLAALGFDALAAEIRQEGPDAAKLLANFIDDPAAAAEADALARGQASLIANSLFDQLGADIAAQDITPEFVSMIQTLASASTDPTVAATLANIAAALSQQLILTPTIGPPAFSPEAQRVIGGIDTPLRPRDGTSGGLTPQGNIELNINNPVTQDLNTDAARAAQTVGAVINAGRNFAN